MGSWRTRGGGEVRGVGGGGGGGGGGGWRGLSKALDTYIIILALDYQNNADVLINHNYDLIICHF